MSKEKTRAELHAEVADLKAKVAESINNLQGVIISRDELKEKYDALEKEASELKAKLHGSDCSISILNTRIGARDTVIRERDAEIERLKEREKYLEGELETKTNLNTLQGDRIQKYSESIERIRADRDKAQYIAADLLEHGVFHFLIVKYRNLKSK